MEPVADVRAEAVPKKAGHLSTPHRIILAILEYPSKVKFLHIHFVIPGDGCSCLDLSSIGRESAFSDVLCVMLAPGWKESREDGVL